MTFKLEGLRLQDAATFRNGLNFTKESRGTGCPFIGVSDFSKPGELDYEQLKQVSGTDIASADDYLRQGDIVFVRSNGNKELVGRSIFIDKDEPALFSGFCIRARIDSSLLHPKFAYFYSKSGTFRSQLAGASGSNIQNLNQTVLGLVTLPDVKISEQKAVAQVLTNLDAKIELNQRINTELEALAKTIYDYWFVQFDFPDANGRPYKSSGGAMVWNDALKREIPAGWEAKPLSEIVLVNTDSVSPAKEGEKTYKHLSIPTLDETGSYALEKGSTIGSNKFTVCEHDLLVSKLNPWFSRVVADTNYEDLICSTEFVVWRCGNATTQAFLQLIATHPHFVAYCTQSATGTSNSHKRVNPQVMMRYVMPYQAEQAEKFGAITASLLAKKIANFREARELTQLRDWLLPMLMNGQVRVL